MKTLVLPAPEYNYGAVLGKHKLTKWFLVTVAYVAVTFWHFFITNETTLIPQIFNTEPVSQKTVSTIIFVAFTVYYLFYTDYSLNKRQNIFQEDIDEGRTQYSVHVLKPYLEEKYDIKLDSQQSVRLIQGYGVQISKKDKTHNVVLYDYKTLDDLAFNPEYAENKTWWRDGITLTVYERPVQTWTRYELN